MFLKCKLKKRLLFSRHTFISAITEHRANKIKGSLRIFVSKINSQNISRDRLSHSSVLGGTFGLHSISSGMWAMGISGGRASLGLGCGSHPRHSRQRCAVKTPLLPMRTIVSRTEVTSWRANIFKCLPQRYLLGVWHMCSHFCLTPLVRKGVIATLFCRWGSWGLERSSRLPKVTQPASERVKGQTHTPWLLRSFCYLFCQTERSQPKRGRGIPKNDLRKKWKRTISKVKSRITKGRSPGIKWHAKSWLRWVM